MNAHRYAWLADSEPRCRRRAEPCTRSDFCARELAELPKYGATVADFSLGIVVSTMLGPFCPNFISVDEAVKPSVDPGVKPPMGSAP
ncbi:MAG: hypothetical protein ABI433_17720 [Burkholderiaceae bacterium]